MISQQFFNHSSFYDPYQWFFQYEMNLIWFILETQKSNQTRKNAHEMHTKKYSVSILMFHDILIVRSQLVFYCILVVKPKSFCKTNIGINIVYPKFLKDFG